MNTFHTARTDPTASRIELNPEALAHNLQTFRSLISPATRICAVVKKDAYGHGLEPVARTLHAQGVERFAVYSDLEAEQLLQLGLNTPVIPLGPIDHLPPDSALADAARTGLIEPTLHTTDQLRALSEAATSLNTTLRVHIYLDTGMSRSGFTPEHLGSVIAHTRDTPAIDIAGVHTHFATADNEFAFAIQQRDRYLSAVEKNRSALPPDAIRHIANSYASLRDPSFHLDMIRPGIGLYGCGYEDLIGSPRLADPNPLRLVARWVAHINHIATYPANTRVGYNSSWTTPRETTLAVIPAGHGDGYPSTLSNNASVRLITPERDTHDCPVRGRVNMDQIILDITDVPGDPQRLMNAEVEIYSADPDAPNTVPRLADRAGSHVYEMLCRLRQIATP